MIAARNPEADDLKGLVCAFRLAPFAACGPEVLKELDEPTPVWLHFNVADLRARRWLETQAMLPEAAQRVLLEAHPATQALKVERGFLLVLTDLRHDFHVDPEGFGEMRIYLERTRVITTRVRPLKTVDRLRRGLTEREELEDDTALGVFRGLIESSVETFAEVSSQLSERLDDSEDRILADEYRSEASTLGSLRRVLARLRRHLNANRAVLARVPDALADWADAEWRRSLRTTMDRLDAVGQDLELVQERARLLQDEIAARLAEVTNRSLFVLSVVTTALLPITLLTGVFGMNVGGLPWAAHPHGFARVSLVMLLALVLALIVLRRSMLRP
jgi:zinc transporter